MHSEVYKENSLTHKSSSSLLDYLEAISLGHPDPLSAYMPYITDTKTNLLHPVLQRFLDIPQYQNDSRYIKLWIIYADSTGKPEDVYNYLFNRNIGNLSSMLHVALADIYESYSWYDLAELAYLKGLMSRAQPYEKLSQCYSKFRIKHSQKPRYSQPVSSEELRSIPHLRKLASIESKPAAVSLCTTPIIQKSQSRINLSAYKKTPNIERLYHSPYDSKVQPQPPELVHGRLPLGII